MSKTAIKTVPAKNAVVTAITEALDQRSNFLLLGHKNPDEDCIAAMVAFGLLATKFEKSATICVDGELHEHFDYLIKICKHNSIGVIDGNGDETYNFDTVVVCDTPKPSMIDHGPALAPVLEDKNIVKIEIDHHLEADSAYFGDEKYRLVDEASSSCELIGLIALPAPWIGGQIWEATNPKIPFLVTFLVGSLALIPAWFKLRVPDAEGAAPPEPAQ